MFLRLVTFLNEHGTRNTEDEMCHLGECGLHLEDARSAHSPAAQGEKKGP